MADGATQAVEENVDTVIAMERDALSRRTFGERIADRIAGFAGTIAFVVVHVLGIAAYIAWNAGVYGAPVFDPYPYNLASAGICFEGVCLTAFVLIKQNRIGFVADRRAHLALQISLLSEREITRVLQLVEKLAHDAGVHHPPAPGHGDLSEHTDVEDVARALHERLEEAE